MNPNQPTTGLQTVQQELTCPLCGNTGITTSWHAEAFNYGTGESVAKLTVDVPVRCCEDCDFDYLDDEAERLKHGAVCRHLGVLAPGEIRHIRNMFGMTRTKFSQVTGFGEASLNRWENGLNIQTRTNDRYLRLLAACLGITRDIERFVNRAFSARFEAPPEQKFRVLTVTDSIRKEQESFQLLKAA